MRKLMLTLGLFAALGVCAQETIKTTANKFNGYGIVYSLPRTALDIEVTVTRSVEKAGPFAKYAQKYLGTAPTANTDRSVWKIDGIKVNPIGKADPDKQFAIQLKGENSTSFYLDSEGILVAINEQPKKNKHPLANKPHKPNDAPKYTFDKSDYAQLYTEEMLVAGSTAKMAESAAKQIYLLREYRLDLLTGNSDEIPQERSFEILLNEMNKREALLTSLFMGTVETESSVKHIIYLPPVNCEKHTSNEIAFRFSERNGIVAPDNLSGEPIYISVNGTQIGTVPTDAKGNTITPVKGALIYTIPGKADVKISYKGKTLCTENLPLSQLGVDFGLDPTLFTGKNPMQALFCPATGALINIK